MNPHRRLVVVPTDYGPIQVEIYWLDSDPLADAVQPRRATLTAERIYDGLDWVGAADVTLDEHLSPTGILATLDNPLHDGDPSEEAVRSWLAEAARFIDEHLTPTFTLALVRAGADDWLGLTGRRAATFRRRLAEEQEAHRGAVLARAVAYEDDPEVRIAATGLLDGWVGSDKELLDRARRIVAHGRSHS